MMSNTDTSNNDDDDTFIAVPNVHVPVTMYGNGFSTISFSKEYHIVFLNIIVITNLMNQECPCKIFYYFVYIIFWD